MASAPAEVAAELAALREDIRQAGEALALGGELALARLAALRAGEPQALEGLEAVLCGMIEACAFEDIAGQRLSRVERLLAGQPAADTLMEGPQRAGQGLSQAQADRLMTARR